MAAPRVPARLGHRRDQDREPAGHRLHPGRARHHRLGRHQRPGRGQLAGDHPHRRDSSSPTTAPPSRSAPVVAGYEALPETERRAKAAALAPTIRGIASADRPQVGHYTDSAVVLEFLSREKLGRVGRAGHVLPGSLPAHQGQAARRRPPRHRRRWRTSRPGWSNCTRPTATTTRATTTGTPPPTPRRSGVRTRRSCWSPGSGCSPSARTSRPPGSPVSSTSTRST